jgi:hypothetical protein
MVHSKMILRSGKSLCPQRPAEPNQFRGGVGRPIAGHYCSVRGRRTRRELRGLPKPASTDCQDAADPRPAMSAGIRILSGQGNGPQSPE